VVGIFETGAAAQHAVAELRHAGFRQDQIGVLVRDPAADAKPHVHADVQPETGAAVGAVTGGVVGGLLGGPVALTLPGVGTALAAGIFAGLLGGATVGITSGGLVGGLIGMGLSEEEAQHYEREFTLGRTLVTVQPEGRDAEAVGLLTRCGAFTRTAPEAVSTPR